MSAGLPWPDVRSAAAKILTEWDTTHGHGKALGLTTEAIDDVIRQTARRAAQTPHPMDWWAVRAALSKEATRIADRARRVLPADGPRPSIDVCFPLTIGSISPYRMPGDSDRYNPPHHHHEGAPPMSNLIHCDGSGCDKTKSPTLDQRMCDTPWIHVDQGHGAAERDFCSKECLTNWSTGKPRAATDAEPCTCHAAKDQPHSKAEHQAYPQLCDTTTVDGR